MRIRIHRGTQEIGGTCIEIEAQGKRVALDVGLPLDAPDEAQESLLPQVRGFREPTTACSAWSFRIPTRTITASPGISARKYRS